MQQEANKNRVPAYVWFDSEFTSLDVDEAHLLQVALVITDTAMVRMCPDNDLTMSVKLPATCVVSNWVAEHIPAIVAASRSEKAVALQTVDQCLADAVDKAVGLPAESISNRPVLAGNSIHADMAIVKKLLPTFASRLNYRMLDVSTLKLLVCNTFDARPFDKENPEELNRYLLEEDRNPAGYAHDAGYDVRASIAEMRYYTALFTNVAGTN